MHQCRTAQMRAQKAGAACNAHVGYLVICMLHLRSSCACFNRVCCAIVPCASTPCRFTAMRWPQPPCSTPPSCTTITTPASCAALCLQGTFGSVRRCVDTTTGEAYAVKVIPKRSSDGKDRSPSIAREVQMWRMLAALSPRVVGLQGAYQDSNNIFLVQELLLDDMQKLLDEQVRAGLCKVRVRSSCRRTSVGLLGCMRVCLLKVAHSDACAGCSVRRAGQALLHVTCRDVCSSQHGLQRVLQGCMHGTLFAHSCGGPAVAAGCVG
jgi:hypothetical protein